MDNLEKTHNEENQTPPAETGWENMDILSHDEDTVDNIDAEEESSKHLPEAPKGYQNIQEIANEFGVSDATIFLKLHELGIEPVKMKKDKHFGTFITPEQKMEVKQTLSHILELEKPREDFLTVTELASILGVKRDTIDAKIKKLGLTEEVGYYRHERGGVRFISPEQRAKIEQSLTSRLGTEQPGKDFRTIPEFAKELGIGFKKLYRDIDKLKMDVKSYSSKSQGSRSARFLSPEQQDEIKRFLSSDLGLEQPMGKYRTLPETAKKLGIGKKLMSSLVDTLLDGDEIEVYKGRNGKTRYLSPEQQDAIRDYIEATPTIENLPKGYSTVNEISDEFGIPTSSIRAIMADLGIPYKEFRDSRNVLVRFISPEDRDLIVERAEQASEKSSIPENTAAFYLMENGFDIKQNIRPNWMKNPSTGYNLEIDIFIESLNIGIEYDGVFWHQDVAKDIRKDQIAAKKGIRIIHIRENGCPNMPEGSLCITREDNESDESLSVVISELLYRLGVNEVDVDVSRDKQKVQGFMQERSRKSVLRSRPTKNSRLRSAG